MFVADKGNKHLVSYDGNGHKAKSTFEHPKNLGPFQSCADCTYPSNGFICYTREGDCMRTDMQRLAQKNRQKKEQEEKS